MDTANFRVTAPVHIKEFYIIKSSLKWLCDFTVFSRCPMGVQWVSNGCPMAVQWLSNAWSMGVHMDAGQAHRVRRWGHETCSVSVLGARDLCRAIGLGAIGL